MQQKQLWISAKGGDLSGVVSAVSQGADVNFKYPEEGDATVLQCAALYGHTDIVAKLASLGADVNSCDKHKWTALHDAALNGHTDTVTKLASLGAGLNAKTDVEEEAPGAGLRTPLTCAAMNGHTETVRKLVSLGADLQARQKDGWTALHLAAKNGWHETIGALVELGLDVNARNEVDMTPLHYAAWDATVETCQKLLDLGVDVRHKAKGKVCARVAVVGRAVRVGRRGGWGGDADARRPA
jgi:ankyrin repeat protein